MEDTAKTHKQDLEKIRQETQVATGQPVESVGNPAEEDNILTGIRDMREEGLDFLTSTAEDLGKGVVGGGTTKIAKETNFNLKNIVFGRFRKKAEDQGGQVVIREEKR